jgi:hypothetical protein
MKATDKSVLLEMLGAACHFSANTYILRNLRCGTEDDRFGKIDTIRYFPRTNRKVSLLHMSDISSSSQITYLLFMLKNDLQKL